MGIRRGYTHRVNALRGIIYLRDEHVEPFCGIKISTEEDGNKLSLKHPTRFVEHLLDDHESSIPVAGLRDNRLLDRRVDVFVYPEVNLVGCCTRVTGK
jgi:hypothetical protein